MRNVYDECVINIDKFYRIMETIKRNKDVVIKSKPNRNLDRWSGHKLNLQTCTQSNEEAKSNLDNKCDPKSKKVWSNKINQLIKQYDTEFKHIRRRLETSINRYKLPISLKLNGDAPSLTVSLKSSVKSLNHHIIQNIKDEVTMKSKMRIHNIYCNKGCHEPLEKCNKMQNSKAHRL